VILVDGDPTYAGTRRDVVRWGDALRPGGHLLLHDAAAGGPRSGALAPLVAEVSADPGWERQRDVGTFVHLRKAG